jgi:serine protease
LGQGNFGGPEDVKHPGAIPSKVTGTLHLNLATLIRRLALVGLLCAGVVVAAAAFHSPAATAAGAGAAATAAGATGSGVGGGAPYVPGVVIVGYQSGGTPAAVGASAAAVDAGDPPPSVQTRVVHLRRGVTVGAALRRLRRRPGVVFAVPDYLAHVTGGPAQWFPDDPGTAHVAQGWENTQWNFLPGTGVNAPEAWANLAADHRWGAHGVVIAVLDTGVAYRNWHQFRKSPDFQWTRFVHPWDFVANNAFPLDREGHGTFVAGTIAESTNNAFGLTGLAYNASIMPVRVLNQDGWGDAATIAEGIRYAVWHGAQVINLSLEFDPSVTAGEIPAILSAIRFAHQHGVVVVAASGNEGSTQIAYPARASDVISVGATTKDRCLANYSNDGRRLDLVAPGGGDDADLPNDPNCHPDANLPDVYQMTFVNPGNPRRFGFPGGWYGTSMAAPHVAAAAAMVIASGVIGKRPSPDAVLRRLEVTAQPLGGSQPNQYYGWGLVNIGAATARPPTPPVPGATGG